MNVWVGALTNANIFEKGRVKKVFSGIFSSAYKRQYKISFCSIT